MVRLLVLEQLNRQGLASFVLAMLCLLRNAGGRRWLVHRLMQRIVLILHKYRILHVGHFLNFNGLKTVSGFFKLFDIMIVFAQITAMVLIDNFF